MSHAAHGQRLLKQRSSSAVGAVDVTTSWPWIVGGLATALVVGVVLYYSSSDRLTFNVKKKSDLDEIIPGLSKVWADLQKREQITNRVPVVVDVTSRSERPLTNDFDVVKQYGLDLGTMKLSGDSYMWSHELGGDAKLSNVPRNFAIVTVTYNGDRSKLNIQVSPESFPKKLGA